MLLEGGGSGSRKGSQLSMQIGLPGHLLRQGQTSA